MEEAYCEVLLLHANILKTIPTHANFVPEICVTIVLVEEVSYSKHENRYPERTMRSYPLIV